jgi:adenylate kinase family enzyme
MPRRILVIGCSGAGKSTLAKVIAARHRLPLIHLDRAYCGRAGSRRASLNGWRGSSG